MACDIGKFRIVRARRYATCRLLEAQERIAIYFGGGDQPWVSNIFSRPETKRGFGVLIALLNKAQNVSIRLDNLYLLRRQNTFVRKIAYPCGEFVCSL